MICTPPSRCKCATKMHIKLSSIFGNASACLYSTGDMHTLLLQHESMTLIMSDSLINMVENSLLARSSDERHTVISSTHQATFYGSMFLLPNDQQILHVSTNSACHPYSIPFSPNYTNRSPRPSKHFPALPMALKFTCSEFSFIWIQRAHSIYKKLKILHTLVGLIRIYSKSRTIRLQTKRLLCTLTCQESRARVTRNHTDKKKFNDPRNW